MIARMMTPGVPTQAAQQDGLPEPLRTWAVVTTALGLMMAVLDGSIANLALPKVRLRAGVAPRRVSARLRVISKRVNRRLPVRSSTMYHLVLNDAALADATRNGSAGARVCSSNGGWGEVARYHLVGDRRAGGSLDAIWAARMKSGRDPSGPAIEAGGSASSRSAPRT